jgi:Spy/CpxP family protein refolding chaperone
MRTTARRFGMLLSATALSLALAAPTASAEPVTTAGGHHPCWHHHHGGLFHLLDHLLFGHHHHWDAEHGYWCDWPVN